MEIPEERGSFLQFCRTLGARNITEFNYREQGGERAQIFVGLNLTRGRGGARGIVDACCADAGYPVVDMTDNEMAKLHVRYMIGGQSRELADEMPVPLRVSRSGPARCCASSKRWARAGTSACSIIAITARTMAACSPASRCHRRARGAAPASGRTALSLCGRNRQPGLPDLPWPLSGRAQTGRPPCIPCCAWAGASALPSPAAP